MKIVMYLNVISIFFHLTATETYNNETLYIPLIKWIRSYYSASAVFLLHSSSENKNFDVWKLTYLSHTWSRLLHREQIATLSSTFKNIHALDRNNTLRPLAIVLLSGSDAVLEFSKYSESFRISHFAWFVIFVPTATHAENYCYNPPGNPFNLLYDTEMLVMCAGDPVLREWYSVDGNNTVISNLVKWYPKKQLKSPTAVVDLLSNLTLHERRNDLKGKVLRAVTIKAKIQTFTRNDSRGVIRVLTRTIFVCLLQNSIFAKKGDKLEGYFSRAVNELEKYLNFTLDIVTEELEFGSFNVTTKCWNGAFRLVASREVDIGLSDFSMTNFRLDYVDYTVPIITTRDCLYFKQPEMSAVKWLAYYKAYSFALWISLLMTIIIAQFTLAFIRSRIESTDLTMELYHEFIRIWGIFCQQGITEEFPRYSSLRLAYFTVLVTGIVIFAAYSASMISYVTAYVHNLPFRSIEEFVNDGTYDVILNKDSADYDMFALSKDPVSVHMMAKLRPIHTLPITIEDGFQRICDDPTLVYYSGYGKKMQGISNFHIPCDIVCIDTGRVDSLSLILPKNSQYTSILNYYVQKLLNTGLLNRFKNEVFFTKKNTFQPVGFYSVASVLIIFFCGVSLALFILIVEMYCNRYRNSQKFNRPINKR
ncbi:glutamate receptor 1 [Bombus vancouverensis nearcticus]|uniref:glutamate receptor 1 n=1 Tax=Bombus vancouverensis nearcticus TaxID=2705178 RepID=UPI00402B7AB4